MMMKCAAIEVRRLNKQAKLVAYHPGTVDSPLSKPFQRSVPEGKLFTPAFSATQLIDILDRSEPDGNWPTLTGPGKRFPGNPCLRTSRREGWGASLGTRL